MPSYQDRNYKNYRLNSLTKTKARDDSTGSKGSLDSINFVKEGLSMNYAKHAKTSYKQCIPEQQVQIGTEATGRIYNSYSDVSHIKNRRKRLMAGSTTDYPEKSKKVNGSKDTNVNVVVLELSEYHKKQDLLCREYIEHRELPKSKPYRTRATQTLYRESSAQTIPYLPGVSNDVEELEDAEIFKLPTILPGDGPPGLYEVEVLERARKRWAFLKSIKENVRHMQKVTREHVEYIKHEHILTAFEWEHWIEREEYIQECQLLRLEILIRMFNDRERNIRATSNERLQMSCKRIKMEREKSLKKNATIFARSLRVLNSRRDKVPRTWRKEPIINELAYPSSDFYAPKMRYGVNPNRRHCQLSHKGFDLRMDDLEKQAINMDPKKLECPFAKLRTWSKPKQILQEFEQNFCSEDNLQKLYETLRNLRIGAKRERVTPQCLKVKRVIQPSKSVVEESEEQQTKDGLGYEDAADNETDIEIDTDLEQKSETSETPTTESTLQEVNEETEKEIFADELKQQKLNEKLQNEFFKKERRREEIEDVIASYEGNTIGWLMRFLSEEMARIKEQRKLHFFCMLAQRERWHREAVEAGLRQKENCMRATYEKLYEECDSTNVEITEKCLQDIMNTDIADYAHQDAENSIVALAKTIDKDIESWIETFNEVQTPLNRASLRCSLKAIVMADKNEILCRLVKTEIIKYIINDVLLENVFKQLEPYDISTAIINDLIDRLIDNDLYLFSTECSSAESDYVPESTAEAQHEAKAILRKLIRQSVPGRRWRTSTECLVDANINELLDEVFNIEATKEFIYEDESRTQFVPSKPSFTNIMRTDLHERPFYSEESKGSTTEREINVCSLNDYTQIWGLETTKELRDSEHLLIIDPDLLSLDKQETGCTSYTKIRPHIDELSSVHKIPSSHVLPDYPEFSKTPIYAPSTDEDEEVNSRRKSESILSEARDRILSMLSEQEEDGELISDVEIFDTEGEPQEETELKENQQQILENVSISSCEDDPMPKEIYMKKRSQHSQTLPREHIMPFVNKTNENKENEITIKEQPQEAQTPLKETKSLVVEESKVNVNEENAGVKRVTTSAEGATLNKEKSRLNINEREEKQQPDVTTTAEGAISVENKEESKVNVNVENEGTVK